jgi:hypothetical protein
MGCCLFALMLSGMPRVANIIWWLFRPGYWAAGFAGWTGGVWLWSILGILFLPWTTLMYMIVYPGGLSFINWLFLGLALVIDIGSYGGGWRANQTRTA